MKNFLSNYDSEDEDDEEQNGEKGSDSEQSDSSPVGPNSILLRHHNHQSQTKPTPQISKEPEPEPLELLGESPEYEQVQEMNDDMDQDKEKEKEPVQEEKSPRSAEKRSMPSSNPSSSRSHSSSARELPEKKPALADEEEGGISSKNEAPELDQEASSLARSMIGKLSEEILLPPEPSGECSRHLQDRIIELLNYTRRSGLSFVEHAERSKSFRNPSIYEKLVEYCKIDENGTNFPPEIYNPYIWGKESFYEELGKVQRQEMERREKERAQRPAGQQQAVSTSSTQPVSMQLGNMDERERKKSKWDTAAVSSHSRPVVQLLSGTAKIIPATGAFGLSQLNKHN